MTIEKDLDEWSVIDIKNFFNEGIKNLGEHHMIVPTKDLIHIRLLEIIEEQEKKIHNLELALGMIPKGELHE